MEPVRSPKNKRVAGAGRLRRARERRSTGLTLIEGPNLLAAAVTAGVEVVEVFALEQDQDAARLARRAGATLVTVTASVLDRLAPTETPRGPVAIMPIPAAEAVTGDAVVLGVTDPGNAGTLIRTAAAFGMSVVTGEGSVDVWGPKVLRAGAGAHFSTIIGDRFPADAGSIATVVSAGDDIEGLDRLLDPDRDWAVLVGSEAHGLAPEAVESADVRVTIPMPGGTESLNAAVAGAIVMYELARWRRRVGGSRV